MSRARFGALPSVGRYSVVLSISSVAFLAPEAAPACAQLPSKTVLAMTTTLRSPGTVRTTSTSSTAPGGGATDDSPHAPEALTEWKEFEGVSVVRPLWDGQGNIEEYQADAPDRPIHAVSLHLYDPRSRQWSLSWADRSSGTLGTPTTGEFRGDRGEFFSFEEHEGPPGPPPAHLDQSQPQRGGVRASALHRRRQVLGAQLDHAVHARPRCCRAAARCAVARPMAIADAGRDGVHGFDFLHGQWRIRNRRLRRPLTGSTEWYEFDGSSIERPFWDGQGNLEEYEGNSPDGRIRGLALRLYDVRSKQWSIHWSNSAQGTRERAMIGEFKNGRGEFYNQDQSQGREIIRALHLDQHQCEHGALGAVVLGRRRADMGTQLDHGPHPSRHTSTRPRSRRRPPAVRWWSSGNTRFARASGKHSSSCSTANSWKRRKRLESR